MSGFAKWHLVWIYKLQNHLDYGIQGVTSNG